MHFKLKKPNFETKKIYLKKMTIKNGFFGRLDLKKTYLNVFLKCFYHFFSVSPKNFNFLPNLKTKNCIFLNLIYRRLSFSRTFS